jgi:hypothetical protein
MRYTATATDEHSPHCAHADGCAQRMTHLMDLRILPVMLAGFAAAVGFTLYQTPRVSVVRARQPRARGVHRTPPPCGGLAIYGSWCWRCCCSPTLLSGRVRRNPRRATWLVLVCFVDDRNGMLPLVKHGGRRSPDCP